MSYGYFDTKNSFAGRLTKTRVSKRALASERAILF
jgi:hypothetical protein